MHMTLLEALHFCWQNSNYSIPKNNKNITVDTLLEFIASKTSTSDGALGYSSGGWSKFINKVFPDKPKNTNYYGWLLHRFNLIYCPSCSLVKPIDMFSNNSSKINTKNPVCKSCFYLSYKDIQKPINANRRAKKLNAAIGDYKKEISRIYLQCPEGYEVDHIVPLQGKYVCGLHVPWNLQYLSVESNRKKRNYHISEIEYATESKK